MKNYLVYSNWNMQQPSHTHVSSSKILHSYCAVVADVCDYLMVFPFEWLQSNVSHSIYDCYVVMLLWCIVYYEVFFSFSSLLLAVVRMNWRGKQWFRVYMWKGIARIHSYMYTEYTMDRMFNGTAVIASYITNWIRSIQSQANQL